MVFKEWIRDRVYREYSNSFLLKTNVSNNQFYCGAIGFEKK